MTKDEALKLALEALKESQTDNDTMEFWDRKAKAINAIKEALAQPAPVQEPVLWKWKDSEMVTPFDKTNVEGWTPLYTTPPAAQRQWVGLTDEEMRELEKQFEAERVRTSDEEYLVIYPATYWQWQRAIEAKLKEKNT